MPHATPDPFAEHHFSRSEVQTCSTNPDPVTGLPNNPLGAIVAPRPIGWISSQNAAGVTNLAPYSFFNAVAYDPPQVMFAATSSHAFGGLKDSVLNAESTGEFVVNLATFDLRGGDERVRRAGPLRRR